MLKILLMKKLAKKNLITVIGIAIGAISGYLYWQFVGCNSGTCAITSNPINSTVYAAVMGGLFFSMFQKNKEITPEELTEL